MGFKVTRNGRQVRYCQTKEAIDKFIDACVKELNQRYTKVLDNKSGDFHIVMYQFEHGVQDVFIIENVTYPLASLKVRTA